jgi:hypothetical protein
MLAEIAATLTGLNTFKSFTEFALQAHVDAALREKAIESQAAIISVQSAMLALQSQYQSLLDEKAELEKRLIEIEDWKAEASKYSLKEVGPGAFVYMLKADVDTTTPSHWLCARCYEDKQKSILQQVTPYIGRIGATFGCHRCRSTILFRRLPVQH